jgi:hypothetical protein
MYSCLLYREIGYGQGVFDWFRSARLKIPIGESDHKTPGLGLDLTVHGEAMEIPVVGRLWPKDKRFSDVLGKAVAAKLPKLAAVPESSCILLVEDTSMVLGLTVFAREIDGTREGFPELAQMDSVWVAKTPVWDSEKTIWFFHVSPGGVRGAF